jgi:predicted AAA+ superfamily ATPase
MQLKYGVDSPLQNLTIREKWMKSCKNYKFYSLPSGRQVKIQGFENLALDILLKRYSEDQIVLTKEHIPTFKYQRDGINHTYFPDVYIPHENLIIEVKSKYTFNLHKEVNILKMNSVKASGYLFKFMMFDKNLQLINFNPTGECWIN